MGSCGNCANKGLPAIIGSTEIAKIAKISENVLKARDFILLKKASKIEINV